MNIDDLIRVVVEREASDLHLKVGSPPVLRIHGALIPYDGSSGLTSEDIQEAFEHITTEEQRKYFAREMELDFLSLSLLSSRRIHTEFCYFHSQNPQVVL